MLKETKNQECYKRAEVLLKESTKKDNSVKLEIDKSYPL